MSLSVTARLNLRIYRVLVVQYPYAGVGVLIGFGHLLRRLLEGHYLCRGLGDVAVRHGEHIAVNSVEALRHVARKLQVLLLVDSHGHQVSLVQQDIRRHQHGVGEQSCVDIVRVLRGLVLELGHSGQLSELGVAGENPAQLRVVGIVPLHEQRGLLRVKPCGDEQRVAFLDLVAQLHGVLPYGDGVQVRNAEVAVVVVLELHPVPHCAEVISQVGSICRLDKAQHIFLLQFFHGDFLSAINVVGKQKTAPAAVTCHKDG